jgi:hypothetical protein
MADGTHAFTILLVEAFNCRPAFSRFFQAEFH